jgi:hypothetical protein
VSGKFHLLSSFCCASLELARKFFRLQRGKKIKRNFRDENLYGLLRFEFTYQLKSFVRSFLVYLEILWNDQWKDFARESGGWKEPDEKRTALLLQICSASD